MKTLGLQVMAQLELPAFSLDDWSYPAVLDRIQQCLGGLAPIARDGTHPDSHLLALVKSANMLTLSFLLTNFKHALDFLSSL